MFKAEFCMDEMDCRLCPFFLRRTEGLAICMYSERRGEPSAIWSVLTRGHDGRVAEVFPMPTDCPLDMVASSPQRDGLGE